jgi:hypothetical protein
VVEAFVVDSSGGTFRRHLWLTLVVKFFFCCICVLAFSFFLDSTCMVISSGLVLV